MVVSEGAINNIMSGMENTAGVRLHSHRHKLKQRFDIIRKLGQGTYGKVQLAINKETGQEVAIKTIKKGKIETEQDLVRIRREIQIMSSVQHPQIIHIYEVFENRDKMVLVMEYAAGGELYDYLSERKVLLEDEARRVFRQVSSAVYYCHKHKICHRDLKLENILLDFEGNAKIADFGLSNVFSDKHTLDTFCGSPLYASPEIVKGIPYLGPEVDCWSLGVLLYTLVYGAMPFDGSNFRRLVKQITQGDFYEPATPSSASELIKHMLTIKPNERATIEDICNHKWLNKNFKISCLAEAELLANQTPVRLDLLLSLAPKQINSEHMLIQPEDPNEDSQKCCNPDGNLMADQNITTVVTDKTVDPRSGFIEGTSAETIEEMDKRTKVNTQEKTVAKPNEVSVSSEKKKKSSSTVGDILTKKEDGLFVEPEVSSTKTAKRVEKSDSTKSKSKEKGLTEKKKSKKKDNTEVKTEKKKSKKKVTESSSLIPNTSFSNKASDETLKQDISLPPNGTVSTPSKVSSPEISINTSEQFEEITKNKIISDENLCHKVEKSTVDDAIDTEKILEETAAKIEAVEAAMETEQQMAASKKAKPKSDYTIGSPVSNKSSNPSSSVTSPTRSRTGSESSGDRSSRRHSKIFSKAAMFDQLAVQNNMSSPPPEKSKRTPKPGILNLSDLTKKFEDISAAENRNKTTTPLKTSSAKRTIENKTDRLQNQNRVSSKSSNSQPTKLNSPRTTPQREVDSKTDNKEKRTGNHASSKNIASVNSQETISKANEHTPINIKLEPSATHTDYVNTKPSILNTGVRVNIHKKEIKPVALNEVHLPRQANRSRVQKEKVTEAVSPRGSISNVNIRPTNSGSRVRQIEIKLESSDSSDSESEAEKMLKTLTEKREKLEQAKAEKMKLVFDAKDKALKQDMPAIKEESRTPTTTRHALSPEVMISNENRTTLPGDIKSKERNLAILMNPESVIKSNSGDDSGRKKTQMEITLNTSKPNFSATDSSINRPSSRSGKPDYSEMATGNRSVISSPDRAKPHLQRARRERIIPILLEDEDAYQQTPNSSRTSSGMSGMMHSTSTRPSFNMTPQWRSTSNSCELIPNSRQERVIPIAMEDEDSFPHISSDQSQGHFRKPMFSTNRQDYRHGMSMIGRSDSFSSAGEDDDDDDEDGFQILTAESLFSTLLSRVRSLTRKIHDDPRSLQSGVDEGRLPSMGGSGPFLSYLPTTADTLHGRTSAQNVNYHDEWNMGNGGPRWSDKQSDEESVFSLPIRKYDSLPREQHNLDQL